MARVSGVDLPKNKPVWIALTYIYGIGPTNTYDVLKEADISTHKNTNELTDEEVASLNNIIVKRYRVEGDLRREVSANIRRLMEIGSYRGIRHRKGLPVRGQRTKCNSRTRKGPKPRVGGIKKKSKKDK